jgi:uncharacterized protein (UPF0262 family)
VLSRRDGRLILAVLAEGGGGWTVLVLPMRPVRRLIQDYFFVCTSYFVEIKNASPSRIVAIDMGRRGLHNEGAEKLADALAGKARVDNETARRLFTLVCVLHIRG